MEQGIQEAKSFYTLEVKCENCGFIKTYDITYGLSFRKFLANSLCEDCGCFLIQKRRRID